MSLFRKPLPKKTISGSHSNKNEMKEASKGLGKASSSSSKNGDADVRIRWTYRTADHERPSVEGFEDEKLSLKKLLGDRKNDNEFKAVGVVGARGAGKTTLCQEYCLNEATSKLYLPRVWVSISKQPNESERSPQIAMLKRMLASLGVDEEKVLNPDSSHDDKLKALLYVLRLQLIGKRYLIVLDDVRELSPAGWYEKLHAPVTLVNTSVTATGTASGAGLASALPKGFGGTVIATSRKEETAEKMVGEANVHRVLPLSDPKSLWKIFCDVIDKRGLNMGELKGKLEKIRDKDSAEFLLGGNKTDIMLALETKVTTKSNGLPLTAKLMAETMPELLLQWEQQHPEQEGKKVMGDPEKAPSKEVVEGEEVGKEVVPKEITGQIQKKEEEEDELKEFEIPKNE